MMDAGIKVTMGADTHEDSRAPMHSLQVLVTRETQDGRVWGAAEKLDRKRALLMFTRYGAEYVLRQKEIGSIEVGKLADLVVLDKNPLDAKDPRQPAEGHQGALYLHRRRNRVGPRRRQDVPAVPAARRGYVTSRRDDRTVPRSTVAAPTAGGGRVLRRRPSAQS